MGDLVPNVIEPATARAGCFDDWLGVPTTRHRLPPGRGPGSFGRPGKRGKSKPPNPPRPGAGGPRLSPQRNQVARPRGIIRFGQKNPECLGPGTKPKRAARPAGVAV